MIISRTPFRISFLGGGTDYPAWFLKHGGSVLSTSIDKYCYISCRLLPPFFEHKTRIMYSKIEQCKTTDEIQHPAVRETLRYLKFERGLEIHHDGDLPARSGMGSSSSFTVGFLHALYALMGKMPSKMQLAHEAIKIEQELIKETVGSQDQVSVAVGGLNQLYFYPNREIEVKPLTLSMSRLQEFNSHLMLFYTGIKRTASDVAGSYVNDMDRKAKVLTEMTRLVDEGVHILKSGASITDFGHLLHEAWLMKKSLSPEVSNSNVDELYNAAMDSGAIGGKITGAGGGGFLLLFVPPAAQKHVREALSKQIHVPFKFDFKGSQIIFYDPEHADYSEAEKDRARRTITSFTELDVLKKLKIKQVKAPVADLVK